MKFEKVARTNDLAPGEKMKITLGGQDILLVNIQNTYYAIANKCPHLGGSLYDGIMENGNIVCPRHGSTFDLRTGKNVQGARILFAKFKVDDASSFPVFVEGSDISIEIG